jgi:hypothetical protein
MKARYFALLAVTLVFAACGTPRMTAVETDVTRYAGVLSCTFCPGGTQTELRIRDNGTYELRQTYADTDDRPDRTGNSRGQWTLLTGGEDVRAIYHLTDRDTGEIRYFERYSSRELRKLDDNMRAPSGAGERSLMRIDD